MRVGTWKQLRRAERRSERQPQLTGQFTRPAVDGLSRNQEVRESRSQLRSPEYCTRGPPHLKNLNRVTHGAAKVT